MSSETAFVRDQTIVCSVCDECVVWRSERRNTGPVWSLSSLWIPGRGVRRIVLSAAFAVAALHRRGACPQIQLSGRINPNDASEASLARLPGIGLTRARAIIVLRERLYGQDGRSPVFREPDDLAQVKGIGPATVAGLRPWLRFEGSPSDSNEPTAR
jgi:hypothetical protein